MLVNSLTIGVLLSQFWHPATGEGFLTLATIYPTPSPPGEINNILFCDILAMIDMLTVEIKT